MNLAACKLAFRKHVDEHWSLVCCTDTIEEGGGSLFGYSQKASPGT
jgi:hypothetical protein